MGHLFRQLSKIENSLQVRFILLLLDYDGTLTPIAKTPQEAVLAKDVRGLLKKLSRSANCALGIISGRSLKDIKNAVRIKGVIYAGNHGLEIESSEIKFEHPIPSEVTLVLRNIAANLRNKLSGVKGILVEDKGLTLAIHYRLVAGKDKPALKKIVDETIKPYTLGGIIKINSGKEIYEIKPNVNWDKGRAVLWLIKEQQRVLGKDKILPVYIGDDATDEDAFKVLKNKGLSIFVGRPANKLADYYLKDTEEVYRFLRLLLELKLS